METTKNTDDKTIEIYTWKYNSSNRLPISILRQMADNKDLSLAAIGLLVLIYHSDEPTPLREITFRAMSSPHGLVQELKDNGLIPSDMMIKIINEKEIQKHE
jgi:hypothetical protein